MIEYSTGWIFQIYNVVTGNLSLLSSVFFVACFGWQLFVYWLFETIFKKSVFFVMCSSEVSVPLACGQILLSEISLNSENQKKRNEDQKLSQSLQIGCLFDHSFSVYPVCLQLCLSLFFLIVLRLKISLRWKL